MRIAHAMIVKGTDEEVAILDRCLATVAPHVDGIFLLFSTPKGEPLPSAVEVAERYGATADFFEWPHDFSAARNKNFSMVPKEYDYILWCDADDVWRGLGTLKDVMAANPADAYLFHYLYDFDETGEPRVEHIKTQLVRNDGRFAWKGTIHEDLICDGEARMHLVNEGIDRLHLTTDERVKSALGRNLAAAEEYRKTHPDDPRSRFTLAQSYLGAGKRAEGVAQLESFIDETGSEHDLYLALLWLAGAAEEGGDSKAATVWLKRAIGEIPEMPDAYLALGRLYRRMGASAAAETYTMRGLVRKGHARSTMVRNPRDYDRNPMLLLAEMYTERGRPDMALPMLKGVRDISPTLNGLDEWISMIEKEYAQMDKVLAFLKELDALKTDDAKRKKILKVPKEHRAHPEVCRRWNELFVRSETDGKQVAYFCGNTDFVWSAATFKTKGVGGSEEAVVNLSRQWAKAGYTVTVFNNCGTEDVADPEEPNVTYKPYWTFNRRDRWDTLILWRVPRLCDYDLNAGTVLVDVHDVISPSEFTDKRLAKISKVLLKTNFHRSLFPALPDSKVAVIPNGLDLASIPNLPKEPKLCINTSSPDRSMDVLPSLWKRVKAKVPDARLVWMYGWDIFDLNAKNDPVARRWKEKVVAEIESAGIESIGKVPQHVCLEWYAKANLLLYPTEFAEIDCISVKKAQAAGCLPIATDFGALAESIGHGVKVHSPKTKDDWCRPGQQSFGLEDAAAQDEWVDATVAALSAPVGDRADARKFGAGFDWPIIAERWTDQFSQTSSRG